MSQAKVMEILKKNDHKWLSTEEIEKQSKQLKASTIQSLNKLFKYREVIKKEGKKNNTYRIFLWRIR